MNIGFDMTAILGPGSKNRGIGNYALSLLTTMIDIDEDNRYYIFNVFEDFDIKPFLKNTKTISSDYIYMGRNRELATDSHFRWIFAELLQNFLEKNKIDIFLITSPFEDNCFSYETTWFGNVKTVAIVYDIIPYLFREDYLGNEMVYKAYMDKLNKLKSMDKILAISTSVKNDLVNYLRFDQKKIEVIWGAPDKRFKKMEVPGECIKKLREKFKIKRKFIMCTGGSDSRKNLLSLIHAYAILPRELIEEYQLAIVCKLSEEKEKYYHNIALDYGVVDDVVLTNFVTDEEMVNLYSLASLVAFPSKYEGFGLPVVEAFACGVPVVTSNNSSLVEIAGDAATLVNPFDVKDISDGIARALKKQSNLEAIEKGYAQLKVYNWENVAERAIEAMPSCSKTEYNFKHDVCLLEGKIFEVAERLFERTDYNADEIHRLAESLCKLQ